MFPVYQLVFILQLSALLIRQLFGNAVQVHDVTGGVVVADTLNKVNEFPVTDIT